MAEGAAYVEPRVGLWAIEAHRSPGPSLIPLLLVWRPSLADPASASTNIVRVALDALDWEERAELCRVIDEVLDEARAEGRLPPDPGPVHQPARLHQR